MIDFSNYEIWFVTGSQHLYGPEVLKQVETHSVEISTYLNHQITIPININFKSVLTTSDQIATVCKEANNTTRCIGLITWMHTFSPSKMWINGLKQLNLPTLHLHTQYNVHIPWSSIDMDFMNLNQSAHGGREFGFLGARLKTTRKVVVGHWKDDSVVERIAIWSRVAAAWQDAHHLKIARFGDNMREVAVTEGNKVSAQIQFGYSVNGYGMGDLAEVIDAVEVGQIDQTCETYMEAYKVHPSLQKNGDRYTDLVEAARIECGLRNFLTERGFYAFTDTFENLHGLVQLPGIAVQRLMMDGFGFGAEGDWKTAALLRAMKVMAYGLPGGNSFMEDYTYHLDPNHKSVLGSHMLEICPSIAKDMPRCEIHPLGIGGKSDPVRLVFQVESGPALNASMIDLGHRFRLVVNTVEALKPPEDMPRLPVARVLWQPHPDFNIGASAWILSGGAHHTCYSQNLTVEYLEDFAEIAGIELVVIDQHTKVRSIKQELRWNDMYYRLNS